MTVLLGSLLAMFAAAAPASAAPAPAALNYAALGDSYSSGVGTGNYYPASGNCRRSPESYAPLWASSHGVNSFNFAACSGATTQDVLNNQLSGLDGNTNVVTLTIGGNDVGFSSVLTSCSLGSDSGCRSAIDDALATGSDVLPGRLDATYSAIRQRISPSAQVVVAGYPRLFPGSWSCPAMPAYRQVWLNDAADQLNQIIAGRVAAARFRFADVRGTFSGHDVCGDPPYLNAITWPVNDSYHPVAIGYSEGYLPAIVAVTG
jgi:lysophospholipase L1-like esterase